MICQSCNKLNDADATFCAFCGYSFTTVSAIPPVATAPPGTANANLGYQQAVPSAV